MSLYHEAASFLSASSSEGGSLKSRVYRNKKLKSSPSQVYALVLETCKWSPVLKEVVEKAELLKHERKLTPTLSILLVHDLLLAKGGIALPQSHGLRAAIERHRGRLTSELTLARLRRKAPSLAQLREQVERDSAGEESSYPRWVRVNAVRTSLEDQLETTFSKFERAASVQDVVIKGGQRLYIDPHVPNLVAVTAGIDLTKTEAYKAGKVILQDKASCFPAYLLDPRAEDGDVVDACAAPGNKTTHLAAILKGHQPEFDAPQQTIFAFEKDVRRAQTLEKMVKTAGSNTMTRIGLGQDFLQVDPYSDKFKSVGALLLDPSCSGSGIVGRDSMPELYLPELSRKTGNATHNRKRKHQELEPPAPNVIVDDDGNETVMVSEKDLEARLDSLSSFQLTLLLHAFEFPAARKITYSTCSVHVQENEQVVMRALGSEIAKKRNWRILLRQDQVSGMRQWPVRGLTEACGGQAEVAEACIRSYKDDGQGVMGFFVAGFVRLDQDGGLGDNDQGEGPYLRNDDGTIMRDLLGMPVMRCTGAPVELEYGEKAAVEPASNGSDQGEDEDDEDDDESMNEMDGKNEAAKSSGGRLADMEADEWHGIGD